MTAATEPGVTPMGNLNESRCREMANRQELFDATLPGCRTWCDTDGCERYGHHGDALLHYSGAVTVAAAVDFETEPTGQLGVRTCQYDSLSEGSAAAVILSATDVLFTDDDWVYLTPERARELAAHLLTAADRAQPDHEVPAEQVRVGDQINVDGEWMQVYCVLSDESGGGVEIFASNDPENWADEIPQCFELGARVWVHRGGDPR